MAVRILVVEDDEVSRQVLAVLLGAEGYQVETVESGEAALLYLRVAQVLPGVVLADRQMPGICGDELARRMRALCGAEVILLAMSGSAQEGDSGGEFDGFLLKPFSMAALEERIAGGRPEIEEGGEHAAAASVLDEAVYAKLAAAMPPARLRQLYALCVEDVVGRVAKMRRAASASDEGTYLREAHAIKGGCGMVGAKALQTLATSMEEQGLRGDHVASREQLLMACERLRRMLVAHGRMG